MNIFENENIEFFNDIALLKADTHFTLWVKEYKGLSHNQYHLQKVKPFLKNTVVDCGANIGTMTLFYAQHSDLVIAIEPHKDAFTCLEWNMKEQNVKCINAAVGSKKGKCSVETETNNIGMTYVKKGKDLDVITIDSLKLGNVSYMKMDIEGYELEALKGAVETIKEYKPILDIEINDATLDRFGLTANDIYSFLDDLGYVEFDSVGKTPQRDVLFKYKG